MSLATLEFWLFWIAIALLIIAVLIIVFYYYHSRKRSNNYLGKQELELRYFIQPTVGRNKEITGYECLLRQKQPDGSWRLPQQLDTLPLQRVIKLLDTTFESLPQEDIQLSINLEYDQIISPEFDYFVRWAISEIAPMRLAVEMKLDPNRRYLYHQTFLSHIRAGQSYGMRFEVDGVGANSADMQSIGWMVGVIDSLKCSMRAFRKTDPGQWLDLNLGSWCKFSQEQHIQLVLTGIESDADEALAEQLNIGLRQGYRFGRPADPYVHKEA
ncbi:EAL domain-containing protein [Lacticaseibacillus zhaodongensis]|uniref:EAL domain-containing protein n=1 Tax=Lacticaseibacillus zhaodongensis TaxID=2668065 RepID=UPI0012D36C07|nr:EAL domain-containing protein [Lacticaseibacillus zhaodongensis]